MTVFRLDAVSWPELPLGAQLLIPTGSTEQHGPHLPFDTDTIIASEVAHRAAERLLDPVIVAPSLAYGASGEHQGFPGTMSIGTDALQVVILEIARSARSWARRLVVINAHGGNVPALIAVTRQLRAEGHDAAWLPCQSENTDAHAGFDETSLMLRLRPRDVGLARPVGNTAAVSTLLPSLRSEGVIGVSPNGVLGDARGSTAAHGELLLREMVDDAVRRLAATEPDDRGCLIAIAGENP